MSNTSDTLVKSFLQLGYETIDGGRYTYEDWSKSMREALKANIQTFLNLSDSIIDSFIKELWYTDYTIGSDTKTLEKWAETIRNSTEIYKEGKAKIDVLFSLIKKYRSSKFFKSLLQFCAHFKELSPYNNMLVKTQMPSARYVLTARQWADGYNRKPKDEARPLVILRKYGPISFVFEIGDTCPIQKSLWGDDDEIQSILEQVSHPYAVGSGKVSDKDYDNLMRCLAYSGIDKGKTRAGADFGALIRKTTNAATVSIRDFQNNIHEIRTKTFYKIFVNERADKSEEFASVCHELGHLFCHHLTPFSNEMWKLRLVSDEQKEFEAECVSYLVCERHGVANRSWTYLSHWLDNNAEVPSISYENIFRAADTIESLLKEQLPQDECTRGLLYRYDKNYKKEIDAILNASKSKCATITKIHYEDHE